MGTDSSSQFDGQESHASHPTSTTPTDKQGASDAATATNRPTGDKRHSDGLRPEERRENASPLDNPDFDGQDAIAGPPLGN